MIKLLLVDDEAEFLDSISPALSRRGFSVGQANDGRTALRVLEEQHYDIVVLDVKMPGLDGVEVFRRIKQRFPEVPVILLTGHGTVQQAFDTAREGVAEYLAKPCDVNKLAAVAREAVARAGSRPPSPAAVPEDGIRVLLVDDEVDFLASLSAALNRRRMEVHTASDANTALRVVGERPVDVVVADVRMPGMDGITMLRRMKELAPEIEVIVLTGDPSVADAIEGMKGGAFDFLTKPQSVDNLVRRISEAFHQRKAREEERRRRSIKDIVDGEER